MAGLMHLEMVVVPREGLLIQCMAWHPLGSLAVPYSGRTASLFTLAEPPPSRAGIEPVHPVALATLRDADTVGL